MDIGPKPENLVRADNLPPLNHSSKPSTNPSSKQVNNDPRPEEESQSEKDPRSAKSFDLISCVNFLTSDAVLEHLKRGKSLEPIFTKADIPNDRARAKVIKAIFQMV